MATVQTLTNRVKKWTTGTFRQSRLAIPSGKLKERQSRRTKPNAICLTFYFAQPHSVLRSKLLVKFNTQKITFAI